MNQLQTEQLELYFGDKYPEYYHRTLNFLTTMLRRPEISSQRDRINANEGGFSSMFYDVMSYVIEYDDFDDGLKAYASYLNEEYSHTNNRNQAYHTKVWLFGDDISHLEAVEAATAFSPSPSVEGIQPKRPLIEQVLRSPEEWELFETIASVGGNSIVSATSILGWPRETVMRIWYRVYRRAQSVKMPAESPPTTP